MKTNPAEAPTGLARRSVLTGLMAAVSTAAIAATGARAESEAQSEIDHMIDLRDRWRALDGQTLAFENRLAKLKEAWFAAASVAPPELAIREADFQLLKEFGSVRRWQRETHFSADDIQAMRRPKAMRYFSRFVAPDEIQYCREPWPLAQQRKDDIVGAFDRWQVDKISLRDSMGVNAAEEALEAHHEKVDAAVQAIVSAPATTARALKCKASMMAEWASDADPFDDWRKVDLATALLEDIAKLDEAAGSTA